MVLNVGLLRFMKQHVHKMNVAEIRMLRRINRNISLMKILGRIIWDGLFMCKGERIMNQ